MFMSRIEWNIADSHRNVCLSRILYVLLYVLAANMTMCLGWIYIYTYVAIDGVDVD